MERFQFKDHEPAWVEKDKKKLKKTVGVLHITESSVFLWKKGNLVSCHETKIRKYFPIREKSEKNHENVKLIDWCCGTELFSFTKKI